MKSVTMDRAIILSAGQGRRLLPLTEHRPKCMLTIAERPILQWQLDTLLEAGIGNITVITGFHSDRVEQFLDSKYSGNTGIEVLYNPFYNVSDNLASCWLARDAMQGNFLLINGDTVFEAAVLDQVLASPPMPVTLAIDIKDSYDEDDMKVSLEGALVRRVSKVLPPELTEAESIGMLYFRQDGPARFRQSVEKAMRETSGLKKWFLSVVDSLADEGLVQACSVSVRRGGEIDFHADLEAAEKILAG